MNEDSVYSLIYMLIIVGRRSALIQWILGTQRRLAFTYIGSVLWQDFSLFTEKYQNWHTSNSNFLTNNIKIKGLSSTNYNVRIVHIKKIDFLSLISFLSLFFFILSFSLHGCILIGVN